MSNIKGILMKIKPILMLVLLASIYVSQVRAATTWIPIAVGDITTIIPFTPTELFSAPNNVNVSLINGVNTLSWDDVEHASKFQVQALNAQGKWVTIATTAGLSLTLTGNNAKYNSFRIVACNYNTCANTGNWSGKAYLRKIIFIHTDLLGSPVAETDINGDVQ